MPYVFTPQVFIEPSHVYSLSFLSTEEFSFSKLDAELACYIFKANSERHVFMWVCPNMREYHGIQGVRQKRQPEKAGNKLVYGNLLLAADD